MRIIRKSEIKGIVALLLIALVLGIILAGMSGKLEQWGLPWFTGAKALDNIIFVSDRSGTKEIYVMNLDGSSQKQLTREAKVLSPPAIPASGNKIAFVGMIGDMSQVMAIGVDGGTPRPLTASSGPKRQPDFSPNGKKLSYIDAGKVYVAELNGGNPDPVLPNHEELVAAMGDPMGRAAIPRYSAYAWGSDSESMAGVSSQDRITDALAYIPSQEGKLQRIMPPDPGTKVSGLAFAANKALLVASVEIGAQQLVIVYDPAEGKPHPVLALQKVKLGAPAVSPDGSVVLLQVNPIVGRQAPGLLKIDLQSGQAGMLVKGIFENPKFSPNGESILAAQHNAKTGKRSIVMIDPASGEVTQLATDGDCFDAVFSPMSAK